MKMRITKRNGTWWIVGPFIHTSTYKFGAHSRAQAFEMAAILHDHERRAAKLQAKR
jgi:hypothetical protein